MRRILEPMWSAGRSPAPQAVTPGLPFVDRVAAGRALAEALSGRVDPGAVVLALPRGGVPVAAEVARAFHAPLGLVLVRKIGAPGQPELAVAALAAVPGAGPMEVERAVDEDTLAATGADHAYVNRAAPEALREMERRAQRYLGGHAPEPLTGRGVVLVDDGIATGTTMRAAVAAVRRAGVTRLLLAVPVASPEAVAALRPQVDELVCLHQPQPFRAVGAHYREFSQVSDEAVVALLDESSGLAAQQRGHLALGPDAG